MRRAVAIYRTTVGKKIFMALTGTLFVLFVIGHMIGNLKAFQGAEKFDHYAEFLRDFGSPLLGHEQFLWIVRLVLVAALAVHVLSAIQLWLRSRRARPVGYRKLEPEESTVGSRTMRIGGVTLLLFLIWHINHLTVGSVHPDFRPGAAHRNLILGLSSWPIAIGYIVAMAALCLHLYHGVWSGLQTLGLNHPRYNRYRRPLAVIVAAVVFIGFVSVPIGVLAGAFDEETEALMQLDPKVPSGPIQEKWDNRRFELKLVNPANKRKYEIIVVGTGLAGASAAASLAELGYKVKAFCFQDSPRRAHSIAAQGGINAAKNYQNDGDSVWRLFYDTVKGGDYRSREANVYRLAEVSGNIIDQCVAQGVPFAREYGGLLANRSFGGAQVSRTFYARGQTGQQLLLGAYQALAAQIASGGVKMYPKTEMLDVVVEDGRAAGIVVRDLVTGRIESHAAHAVCLATGGYSNVFFLSTNAKGCNVTATWRAYRRGAAFANPCFTQIHPTCIPPAGDYQSKLTLMSESLRNDGRIWVPKSASNGKTAAQVSEADRDYYLERLYPSFGNLTPRDIASRRAKEVVDEGRGVGELHNGVYLDFQDAIGRLGKEVIEERYGNLFEMYERITGEDPYAVPMRIYPAPHYTMGGSWVDYDLESTVPGLFILGEANFSDHGANRLGASALMQGLADGYFVIPYTIGNYLARLGFTTVSADSAAFRDTEREVTERTERLLAVNGTRTVDSLHRELGKIMLERCGMARNRAGLKEALRLIPELRERFWREVRVTGSGAGLNQALEKAGRVADFMEFAELMCLDALEREESCGGHFREEYQTEEGEALRNDDDFTHVAVWEHTGPDSPPVRHQEPLEFEHVPLSQRSYK